MTAVIAAAIAVAILVTAVVAVRIVGARSQRRFEAVVAQLDAHMEAISTHLQHAVERSEEGSSRSLADLGFTLDLTELLQRLAEEAATRTGAQAATVRVRGPADIPAMASFGTGDGGALLEAALGPPDGRPTAR